MTNPDEVTAEQVVQLLQTRNPTLFDALIHELRAQQWRAEALRLQSVALSGAVGDDHDHDHDHGPDSETSAPEEPDTP